MVVLFGALGYLFAKIGCEPAPMLLGFIFGPMMEEFFRRALLISRGDFMVFIERPISAEPAGGGAGAAGVHVAAGASPSGGARPLPSRARLDTERPILPPVIPAQRSRSKARIAQSRDCGERCPCGRSG